EAAENLTRGCLRNSGLFNLRLQVQPRFLQTLLTRQPCYSACRQRLQNAPPPAELLQLEAIARRFDVAGRDERNRSLGKAGEERVFHHERAHLQASGRRDLAAKVRWVSQEDGDGAGYDIASFAPNGSPRLIEVKTTNGSERTPFYISRNELEVANARRHEWSLVRLFDFSREVRAFELRPPLEAHVSLMATQSQAAFN
ncbi:DUF3883 domain-containing protein, partial [Rhizobiaceae bacterium n13]|uniref:DUF3883 domain-containing protein n=1 Tax=Ferirhizobium litorale TaxID=2927786 RepID=UPI0024B2C559